jgi:hypothetical protein
MFQRLECCIINILRIERRNITLQNKKAIIIGDKEGIPGPSIEECIKSIGVEVVFSVTECYV